MDISTLYSRFLKHPVISTDTRQIQRGSIFFALQGENFNGNDFAREALLQGAAYAVVSDPSLHGEQYFHVDDTLKALQQLALEHRRHLSIPVIAITGSNGKTTTKEMMASVLSEKYRVHATKGNLNNHIGVPLTILTTSHETEIVICEMGANHIGEIAMLCSIAEPTHGLITNIGKAHLEGFGSFEGVKKAKSELFEFIHQNKGYGFVNADDPSLHQFSDMLERVSTYGLKDDSKAGIHFEYIPDPDHAGFTLKDRKSDVHIHSQMFGAYNAINMVAAYSVGKHFQVDPMVIENTLSSFIPGANRSEMVMWKGCMIIKDAYNANPSSMELALHAFADRYATGIVLLGDMKELGTATAEAHKRIIEIALKKRFSQIYLVGHAFKDAVQKNKFNDVRIQIATSIEEIANVWNWKNCEGQALLLKGSRSMHLEKLLS